MSFNYEPVDARLHRFWNDHPNGAVRTHIVDLTDERVVVRAEVWRTASDGPPDATGHAEEHVGSSHINRHNALENGETSSIGRALANLGYSPKGARPSAEEMAKVERHRTADPAAAAKQRVLDAVGDRDEARRLWDDTVAVLVDPDGTVPDPDRVADRILGELT